MEAKSVLTIALSILLCFASRAQKPDPKIYKDLDSLKKELTVAKHDSDRVRLNIQIGINQGVKRIGYWDTVLVMIQKVDFKDYEVKAIINLADSYRYSHNIQKSIELLKKGLEITKVNGSKIQEIAILSNSLSYSTLS